MVKIRGASVFAEAARELVEIHFGHGEQQELARKMGVRPSYLSGLLNCDRNWSDSMRERFASALGLTVGEVYQIGEEYAKSGVFFPYVSNVRDTAPHSVERVVRILALTAAELHITAIPMANESVVKAWNPPSVESYLQGRIGDADLYAFLKAMLEGTISYYLKKIKGR